jgi:hypothetical protein
MMGICIFPLHCCTLSLSVSSDSIVKGIIDDIIKTAVKTAEVDEQKTKYLQQSCQIKQIYTFHLHPAFIE